MCVRVFVFFFWLHWIFIAAPRLSLVEGVALRPSYSSAHAIFLDQGSDWCLQQWQADSYPLYQHGSPNFKIFFSCLTSC